MLVILFSHTFSQTLFSQIHISHICGWFFMKLGIIWTVIRRCIILVELCTSSPGQIFLFLQFFCVCFPSPTFLDGFPCLVKLKDKVIKTYWVEIIEFLHSCNVFFLVYWFVLFKDRQIGIWTCIKSHLTMMIFFTGFFYI